MIMHILCTVNVTWLGETVTGPLMILHNEIQREISINSLTCRHPNGPVAWYLAIENIKLTTETSIGTFINIISDDKRQAQILRGTTNGGDETRFDGLWTCRLNGMTSTGAFYVGIYDNNPSTGKIIPFPG